jgi:hypothetical protein
MRPTLPTVRVMRFPGGVGPTPGISCEAVPASMPLTGAGMRRHVHSGNHAAESFVSFIPLLDRLLALEPLWILCGATGRAKRGG